MQPQSTLEKEFSRESEAESQRKPPELFWPELHLLAPPADPAQWWVELRYKNNLPAGGVENPG